jgi:endonuclease/exonuclease/phosphatase family metal-dependent hydrolase
VRSLLCGILLLLAGPAAAEPVALRVVAANLTSSNRPEYSPDNGNHSNPEGAGARILKALAPDIVLIQEFNTTVPARQWVNATFGAGYHFMREETPGIPNGVISRYPIAASGIWDDPVLDNREFAWARIRLPGGRDLWVVSVHFHSKNATSRSRQATALAAALRTHVPAGDLLLVGGDLNTRRTDEPCFAILAGSVVIPAKPPHDGAGNIHTNAPRNRPYDWVLAGASLDRHEVPVKLAGLEFPDGLVFDTRVFEPLVQLPPVQAGDSGVKMMQHMAVVRDFLLPATP